MRHALFSGRHSIYVLQSTKCTKVLLSCLWNISLKKCQEWAGCSTKTVFLILILTEEIKSFVTHITENLPRHLVRIVFWLDMGPYGQKILFFTGEIKSFVTHITENPPRHLVHIVFWSGIGQKVQKMAIFGPK